MAAFEGLCRDLPKLRRLREVGIWLDSSYTDGRLDMTAAQRFWENLDEQLVPLLTAVSIPTASRYWDEEGNTRAVRKRRGYSYMCVDPSRGPLHVIRKCGRGYL